MRWAVVWPLACALWGLARGLTATNLLSVTVGNEIFLKGQYIEVGIHTCGSFGTANGAPSGFNGAAGCSHSWGTGIGFTADYGKDGYSVGYPPYSGDYFLPGSPLEGWSVDYTASGVMSSQYMMKGRVGYQSFSPTVTSDTSQVGTLSAVWVGQAGNLKVSKTTQFAVPNLYFVTTVTLQNMGTVQMTNVDYMRNVDPDQEQPFTGNYATRNYVLYQPYRASDGVNRASTTNPNLCMVVAYGYSYSALQLGLGSINQYCRVSHYGFLNNDSGTGWTNTEWVSYSQASPEYADQAINMVMRFPTLDIGASITFTWAYVLNQADLIPALNSIAAISIIQPTNTASGKSCTFSANVVGSVTLVQFYVYFGSIASLVGSLTTATNPNPATGGGIYQISFDSTLFVSASGYSFSVTAQISGYPVTSSKVINIDNTGPTVSLSLSPSLPSPFVIDNVNPYTATATYVSGPALYMAYFYLDLASGSSLLGTASAAPFKVTFSETTLALYTLITIRVVSQSATGAQQVTTVTGIVTQPNMPPTGITITPVTTCSSGPCFPETATGGTVIASLAAININVGNTYSFTVTSGSSVFSTVGSSLVIAAGATFNYVTQSSYTFTLKTQDQAGLSWSGSFTYYVSHVNLPPSDMSLSSSTISEAASVGTLVGTFSVTDRDSSVFTIILTNSGSGYFYVSGMGLYVAKALSYNAASTVTITAQVTDSNSLSYTKNFPITVTWVNKAPTFITAPNLAVSELQAAPVVVCTLSTTDPDPGQTFTYAMVNSGSGQFAISGSNLVTTVPLQYLAGAAIAISIKTTDSGTSPPSSGYANMASLSYVQTFTITVVQVPRPPSVSNTVMSVPENSLLGTVVGAITLAPNADAIPLNFTVNTSVSDPASYTLSTTRGCYILQPAYAFFRVQLCSGTVFVNTTCLNYEARSFYDFNVTVQGLLATTVYVIVNVLDVNEPPAPANANVSVAEFSPVGTVVVSSIPSNDPDYGATASYSFNSGNAGGMFAISNSVGLVTLALPNLNYQNLPVGAKYYTLGVTVSDGQLLGYCTVTVNVLDVALPPVVSTCVGFSIPENSVTGTLLLQPVVQISLDSNNLTYTIVSGANNNIFSVAAFAFTSSFSAGAYNDRANITVINGVTNGIATIDYETTPGFVYPIIGRATDSVGQTATFSCPIAIVDVNEAPWTPPTATYFIAEGTSVGTGMTMANGTSALYVWDQDLVDHQSWAVVSWGPFAVSFINFQSSGTLSLLAPVTYALQSQYWFTARVTDKGGLTATTNVTVQVIQVNSPPVMQATSSRSIPENTPTGADVLLGGQRLDVCATPHMSNSSVSYSISPTNTGFTIVPTLSLSGYMCARILSTAMFDYEVMIPLGGPVNFNITACDNAVPSLCSVDLVSVYIGDVNEAPVMNNTNIGIGENSVAGTLVGAPLVFFDQDIGDTNNVTIVSGNTTVFKLTQLSYTLAQLSLGSIPARLRDLGPRYYLLSVKVTDRGGLSATATVNVSLIFQADPPVVYPATFVIAESVASIGAGSTVGTRVGTVTYYDRQSYSVVFSIISGDPQGQFAINSATGVITVAKATLSLAAASQYFLTIQAMDLPGNASQTQYGAATITVNLTHVNHPPTFPTPAVVMLLENSGVGALVGLPLSAVDVDVGTFGDVLSYTLASYTSLFTVGRFTGQVTVLQAGVMDYTVQNSYSLSLTVTDSGGLSASNTLVVNLVLVPTPPVLYTANRTVNELCAISTLVGAPLTWYDRDTNTGFNFAIVSATAYTVVSTGTSSTGTETFVFNPQPVSTGIFTVQSSGSIVVTQPVLVFASAPVYLLNVTITDSFSLSAWAPVYINLIDINQPPVFTTSSLATKYVNELVPAGTLISPPVVATDPDWGQNLTYSLPAGQSVFGMYPNGSLYVAQTVLYFPTTPVYTLTVIVTDSGAPQSPGAPLSTSASVTVQLLEVNVAPVAVFAGLTLYVNEDCCNPQTYTTGPGSAIGILPATDRNTWDQPFGALKVTFTNTSYSIFSLNDTVHMLSVLAPLNFEAISSYSFSVTVKDTFNVTASGVVTVLLNDVNEVPSIAPQTRWVNENPAKNAVVGAPIAASDVDFGQYLSFIFTSGNGQSLFTINPCSGQITILTPGLNSFGMSTTLDYEITNQFNLTVQVTDDGTPPLSASALITINLNDVNEPPFLTPATFSVPENSAVGTLVGVPLTVWDEDFVDFHTYAITGGNANGYFAINATSSQIRVAVNALDYERVAVYSLSVTVTDKGNLTDTQVFTVNIINVNEPPVILSGQSRSINENSPLGSVVPGVMPTFWDPENDTVSWTIVGGVYASVWSVGSASGLFSVASAGPVGCVNTACVLDYEVYPTYTLTLMAQDHGLLPQPNGTSLTVAPTSSTASITISLLDVLEAPIVPNVTLSINENYYFAQSTGANALVGSLSVYLEDFLKAMSYAITAGDPLQVFRVVDVNNGDGAVNVTLFGLVDYETGPQYVLTLQAKHSTIAVTGFVTVNILDVNEMPFFGGSQQVPNASFSMVVKELSGAGVLLNRTDNLALKSVTALDVDAGDSLTYTLVSGDVTRFAINPSTGVLSVTASANLNYQVQTAFSVLVCATDRGGLKAYANVSIALTQVNKPPFFISIPTNIGVGRLSPDGTVITTLYSKDWMSNPSAFSVMSQQSPGLFDVAPSTGIVTVTGDRTLLTLNSTFWVVFQLTQTSTVDGTPMLASSPLNLTFTVVNQNFPPVLTPPASYSVSEAASVGTVIGVLPFFDLANSTLQFTFTVSNNSGPVRIDYDPVRVIAYVVLNATVVYASLPQFAVTVTVSDNYAFGALSATASFTVYVLEVNHAPYFDLTQWNSPDGMSTLRFQENSTGQLYAGTVVGDIVVADVNTPSEAWGQETFTLTNAVPAQAFPFYLNAVSGDPRRARIFTSPAGPLLPNWHLIPTYYGIVTVTDGGGLSVSTTVNISVVHMNRPPTLPPFTFSVKEDATVGTPVGTVIGSDVDLPVFLTYTITGGNDAGVFALDPSGKLTVAGPMDFDALRVYVLTVQATDGGVLPADPTPLSVLNTVTVNVLNVNNVAITGFSGAVQHATAGNETVFVHGQHFGPLLSSGYALASVYVNYGPTGSEYNASCVVVSPGNTLLKCVTSPGAGAGLRWTVYVFANGIYGDSVTSGPSVVTAYLPPTILALSDSTQRLSTPGGDVITVFGINFGPLVADTSITYGSGARSYAPQPGSCVLSAASPSQFLSNATAVSSLSATPNLQQLQCVSSPGVGAALVWQVTVKAQMSGVFGSIPSGLANNANGSAAAYTPPAITRVSPAVPAFTTRGGDGVTLTGTNFGPSGLDAFDSVAVYYGPASAPRRYTAQACSVNASMPHTSINCLTSSGVGSGHVWTVTVGEQVSAPSGDTTKYTLPIVHKVSGPGTYQAKTDGGQSVTIAGDEFGSVSDSAGMVVATYGHDGTRFTAAQCAVTTDFTSIQCVTAPGTGKDLSWYVFIDGQQSALNVANSSYGQPVVAYYNGTGTVNGDPSCETGVDCGTTVGNQVVDLNGLNYGPASLGNTLYVTYGPNGTELEATGCYIIQDHVRIRCNTVPGAGQKLVWVVVIDEQVSVFPTTAYGVPRINSISGPGSANASTYGGELVVITGANFGPPANASTYFQAVTYGPYTATNCSVLSHIRIECYTIPGVGRDLPWTVFVAGQQSVETVTSFYADPLALSWDYSPDTATTDGGYTLTIQGTNFGVNQDRVVIFVQVLGRANPIIEVTPSLIVPGSVLGYDANGCVVQGNDTVSFVMPQGRGKGLGVRIGRDNIVRSSSTARYSAAFGFDYLPARIALISTRVLPGVTNSSCPIVNPVTQAILGPNDVVFDVELRGYNFGPSTADGLAPATYPDSTVLPWAILDPITSPKVPVTLTCFVSWSHELVRFMAAYKGVTGLNYTNVGMDGTLYKNNTAVMTFDFNSPSITNLKDAANRDVVQADGTTTVRIEGRNLFAQDIPTNVTIGGVTGGMPIEPWRVNYGPIPGTSQTAVATTANQFVEVIVPPWQGTNIPLVVFQVYPATAPASQPYYVDVAPPAVSTGVGTSGTAFTATPTGSQIAITGRADGSSRVVLNGDNFGVMGTYIRFLNTFLDANGQPSTIDRTFTDCIRTEKSIDCAVPPGVGATDSVNFPLQLIVVTPRMECDPAEQARTPTDPSIREWSLCTVIVDPTPGSALTSGPWQFRYEQPVLFASPGMNGVVSTAGGLITLMGYNLGAAQFGNPIVTFKNFAHGTNVSCPVVNPPSLPVNGVQSFTCQLGPGVGPGWVVTATVGGQPLVAENLTFAYATPIITNISISTGETSGGYNVTLTGSNFGAAGFGTYGVVTLTEVFIENGVAAELPVPSLSVLSTSHETVTFVMPPEQGAKNISVTVDGLRSNPVPFVFAAPRLDVMFPREVPTLGNPYTAGLPTGAVTLTGASFGMRGARVEVSFPASNLTLHPNADYLNTTDQVGAEQVYTRSLPTVYCTLYDGTGTQPCSVITQSHNNITVNMPQGMGTGALVRVFVVTGAESVVSDYVTFDYAAPVVDRFTPNVLNAIGDSVTIYGDNFGVTFNYLLNQKPPVVHIGGRPCLNARINPPQDKHDPRPYITCDAQDDIVGPKNLTISTAFRTIFLPNVTSGVVSNCFTGYFGNVSQFCDPCPEGAVCRGGINDDSLPGWYNVTYNGDIGCTARHHNASVCWQPLPCQPMASCLGNNTCATGYVDVPPMLRCSGCSLGHYRFSGSCIPCPSNPWILIVAFILVGIVAAVVGYMLNRKSVNVAFLSIGIDYFQVLAMFSRSGVTWPPELQSIYQAMTAFNFNIDITAPECAMPHLHYSQKWYFVEGLPIIAFTCFFFTHVFQYVRKRMINGRKKKLYAHVPALVGTSLVLMYYLYLNLTRSVLDVFNCQPTTPPTDGKLYLQVVFEECGKKGGIQLTLMPWAILAMALYCFGYPMLVGFILYRNRHKVMEDQLLRAEDMGKSRLENPHCYDLRKMYHKLYYQFRPDCWYWVLVVLVRKFMIAMTALMFVRNPSFQMAVCLLTLFIAYALQVRFSPYMSMSERHEILFQHRRKVEMGDRVHTMLASIIADVKRLGKKTGATRAGMRSKAREAAVNFLWNYNTVESTLLFSAVLVNLAGVMFESGQLNQSGYGAQKELITYLILLVIVISIIYFIVVLVSEVYMMIKAAPDNKKKKKSKQGEKEESGEKEHGKEKKSWQPSSVDVYAASSAGEEVINPMFQAAQAGNAEATINAIMASGAPPTPEQWSVVQANYEAAMRNNTQLQKDLASAKRGQQMQTSPSAQTTNPLAVVRRVATKKTTFGQSFMSGGPAPPGEVAENLDMSVNPAVSSPEKSPASHLSFARSGRGSSRRQLGQSPG